MLRSYATGIETHADYLKPVYFASDDDPVALLEARQPFSPGVDEAADTFRRIAVELTGLPVGSVEVYVGPNSPTPVFANVPTTVTSRPTHSRTNSASGPKRNSWK